MFLWFSYAFCIFFPVNKIDQPPAWRGGLGGRPRQRRLARCLSFGLSFGLAMGQEFMGFYQEIWLQDGVPPVVFVNYMGVCQNL